MKTPILTGDAPAAIGPYSQAVKHGNLVFCSGQIPLDPATGKLCSEDIEDQARQVLKNIQALLSADGLDLSHVVKATIFLTDLANFQKVNALYAEAFPAPFPARSTIQVAALPAGASVEIEVIAIHS